MASARSSFYFVPLLLLLLLVASSTSSALASMPGGRNATARLRPGKEQLKYERIHALLKKLNKPSVKTIQVTDDGNSFLFFFG